jgi:hypothetical protein
MIRREIRRLFHQQRHPRRLHNGDRKQINGEYEYEEEEANDGLDFTPPPPGVTPAEINNIAVLNSSVPEQLPSSTT